MVFANPLTRLSRHCGIAALSPKGGEGIVKNYAGQDAGPRLIGEQQVEF